MDEVAKNLKAVLLLNGLFLEELCHNCDSISKFLKLLIALSFVSIQFVHLVLSVLVIRIELLNLKE